MAPKTLPPPRPDPSRDVMPGGRSTFWDAAPVNFSTFAAVYNPQTFCELLMTRQVEQLFPSWPGVADFRPTLQVAPGPLMLRELPRLAATLFPGREHPRLWTNFELSLVQATVFQLVFRQPLSGVPRTLNADEMCAFMVWMSFPSELLVPRLQNTLHGQAFVLQGSDCTWGSNGFLNFLFSPRSALLMLLFGLMIRRQQGLPDFVHTAMVTTLGMRLSWRRWNELLQNANVWNRRYADFFVAMAGTLSRISRMRGVCSPW